jgi:5'-methylthioadenosine phosphorylase
MGRPRIGIIGGSGLYQMDGLTDIEWRDVDSPFGAPSDELCFGRLDGVDVVFLPRHGRQHGLAPGDINYRANIDALKRSGVTDILSLSAVGGLQERHAPGFFGAGCVAHVSMADPVCRRLGDALEQAAGSLQLDIARGGTYLAMEGPQFSSRAESELYRSWGCAVIGMTNMPEAKLAREAEICYATVAMVTDYDCWHDSHGAVTVEMVVQVLHSNADRARSLVRAAVPVLGRHEGACPAGCRHALDYAVLTRPEARDPAVVARLDAIAGRVLAQH